MKTIYNQYIIWQSWAYYNKYCSLPKLGSNLKTGDEEMFSSPLYGTLIAFLGILTHIIC